MSSTSAEEKLLKVEQGISVVIPTYNEVENIRPLCERLFKTFKENTITKTFSDKQTVELLLVDDESVGSEESVKIVEKLAKEGYPIRIHRRYKKEGRGLSSAVLLGLDKAKYEVIVSMDADLQHEPEAVPDVLKPVLDKEAEFTVGCRYMDDKKAGVAFDWSLKRRILSLGATALAWGLVSTRDPMSGFICLSKSVLYKNGGKNFETINPIGFKIGLEIMVRCACKPVQDVPIMFQERLHGESKLSTKQTVEYVQQLMVLYRDVYRHHVMVSLLLLNAGMYALMHNPQVTYLDPSSKVMGYSVEGISLVFMALNMVLMFVALYVLKF